MPPKDTVFPPRDSSSKILPPKDILAPVCRAAERLSIKGQRGPKDTDLSVDQQPCLRFAFFLLPSRIPIPIEERSVIVFTGLISSARRH